MSFKTALVILSDFAEELEVASPVDVLRLCNVNVTVAGINGINPVKCARGLNIVPDTSLEEVRNENFDAIILPGGRVGSDLIADSELVGEILKRHDQQGRLIAGICGSPKAFLKNKIRLGSTITSYPSHKDVLHNDYNYVDDSVVQDGNLITARGPAQALQWSKIIAENLVDKVTLKAATERMLFD